MAKTNPTEKKGSASFFVKFARWFKRLFVRLGRSFKDTYAELKKVTWPSRGELFNHTLIVIVFIVLMGAIILAIDTGAAEVVRLITGTRV